MPTGPAGASRLVRHRDVRGAGTRTRYRGAIGVSTAFGTFGELLQGVLPEPDGDFLVTLPIARWTIVTFHAVAGERGVEVRPGHKWKARRLAEMVLDSLGYPGGGVLTVHSTLPEGKGLASSSADLVATARAVANALNHRISATAIESLLARVEPTDGVLYPGIVAFHHRSVRLRAVLGRLPTMTVVGVDEGGTVDTLTFNRMAKPFSHDDQGEYERLLDRLAASVGCQDLRAVGTVATRSAEMNQVLRPKRTLADVKAVCAQVGGLGVVAAHSGTMLGILLDTADPFYVGKLAAAIRDCSAITPDVSLYRSLSFE